MSLSKGDQFLRRLRDVGLPIPPKTVSATIHAEVGDWARLTVTSFIPREHGERVAQVLEEFELQPTAPTDDASET